MSSFTGISEDDHSYRAKRAATGRPHIPKNAGAATGRPLPYRTVFPPYIGSLVIASKIKNPQMILAAAENLLILS